MSVRIEVSYALFRIPIPAPALVEAQQEPSGGGSGLAAVGRVIEGKLRVEDHPSAGAVFIVTVPLPCEAGQAATPSLALAAGGELCSLGSVMAGLTERQLVTLLGGRFQTLSRDVCIGIGDDAAVLSEESSARVISVDASVEGIHFDRAYLSLEDVGYRAFQAAVSDLAAMGAEPVGALSALILPRSITAAQIDQLTAGQAAASLACHCPVVGGNISRGHELSVTTTVLGRCRHPLRRDTARRGDQVWLVGPLGLAAAGLAALRLRAGRRLRRADEEASDSIAAPSEGEAPVSALERCMRVWQRPEAQLSRGRELVGVANAAIDISDGLAADAWQLARASGVRVVVERERLRASLRPELLLASRALRRSALQLALYGGEDYALLATGPSSRRPRWAEVIGYVTEGQGAVLASYRGTRPLGRGYDHLVRS